MSETGDAESSHKRHWYSIAPQLDSRLTVLGVAIDVESVVSSSHGNESVGRRGNFFVPKLRHELSIEGGDPAAVKIINHLYGIRL